MLAVLVFAAVAHAATIFDAPLTRDASGEFDQWQGYDTDTVSLNYLLAVTAG